MSALWDLVAVPLGYGFMQRALMVAVLVGAVCAVLSCYLVLKGWSLMGDAISHAVLPGIVFDTDPSEHHHMLLEQDGTLIDVRHSIGVSDLPVLPPGSRVKRVDVVIRLESDARESGAPRRSKTRRPGAKNPQ